MPVHLASVPDPAPRAIGLIRVSKVGQRIREELVSPETQRFAIKEHAARRGYVVTGYLRGIDETGSRTRSSWWAKLNQAVESVETGQAEVVVAWKFHRAARHRLRWALALDRIESAGGRLESATEDFDTTTASGRLARGMTAEINAYQAEVIGEGWKEAHAARVRAGKPANGKPRFGYTYDRGRKLHVPDPVTGPVLADLYRRYVAGESVYDLVRWLNAHGWRTTNDGLWSDRSLRRVLDSGFASGRFLAGGDTKRKVQPTLHEGVHEPLIGEDLWQAYQDARAARRGQSPRTARSSYLLSGLVRCAKCGGTMVAGEYGSGHRAKYRCKNGKEHGPERCVGGYVMADYVERHVYEWLQELAGDVDRRAEAAGRAAGRAASMQAQESLLDRQVAKAREALARLAVQNAERPLPEDVYRDAVAELVAKVDGLARSLELVRTEARRAPGDVGAAAAGLLAEWETTPVAVRREVLRSLVGCVLVRSGRPRAVVMLVEAWEVRPAGTVG